MSTLSSRRWARLLLIAVLPTLAAGKCRDKNKDDSDDDDGVSVAQDIEVSVSVVSVNPSVVEADTPFTATVRGSGFARGAQVWVGGGAADATEFLDSRSIRIEGGPMAEGRYDVEVVNPDGGSSTLRQGLTVQTAAVNCDPITVYFETASSNLTADSNSRLQRELSCYRDSSGPIRIEGHCDERGTIDYNIALGERRARSVSRWFSGQGVEASRLSTVSFGEEKPVANGHDEQSWSQNRRAEIRLGR